MTIVGLDAATGMTMWTSALSAIVVFDVPTICEDSTIAEDSTTGESATSVCFTAQDVHATRDTSLYQLNGATGQITTVFKSIYRGLGGGLYDAVGSLHAGLLAHVDFETGIVWAKSAAALFGPGRTSNGGWDLDAGQHPTTHAARVNPVSLPARSLRS